MLGVLAIGSTLVVAQFAGNPHGICIAMRLACVQPPGTPVAWLPPGGGTLVVVLFSLGEVLLVGFILWQLFLPGLRLGPQLFDTKHTPLTHNQIDRGDTRSGSE